MQNATRTQFEHRHGQQGASASRPSSGGSDGKLRHNLQNPPRYAPYQQRPHTEIQMHQTSIPHETSALRPPTAEEEADFNSIRMQYTTMLGFLDQRDRFTYTNDVSNYERIQKIGQGTFGEVFKARCKKTGRMVALKKLLTEKEQNGFPITALREIKFLMQLKHPHITDLIEVCSSRKRDKTTFYLVFTFCNYDLAGLLSNLNVTLKLVHQKTLIKHLLSGLYHIHRCKMLHRDIKAANILISSDGILKLADFGLARPFTESAQKAAYTDGLVTLWYRPPELLLGERMYTTAVDMWGAGCIMAEFWTRTPIMQGETEQRQLALISRLCGPVDLKDWPEAEHLPLYGKMITQEVQRRRVQERLAPIVKDTDAMWLLDKLLTLNPVHRPDAEAALDADFFFKAPLPADDVLDLIRSLNGESMFDYTTGRGAQQNRARQNQQHAQLSHQRPAAGARPANEYRDIIF